MKTYRLFFSLFVAFLLSFGMTLSAQRGGARGGGGTHYRGSAQSSVNRNANVNHNANVNVNRNANVNVNRNVDVNVHGGGTTAGAAVTTRWQLPRRSRPRPL